MQPNRMNPERLDGTETDRVSLLIIFEARSPAAGGVLFIHAVPSMTKGEAIANIGSV